MNESNLMLFNALMWRHQIISYGPSGIGFVNFGEIKNVIAKGEIITYGLGARGFNQYDGTVESIKLKSITTHGDGSIGIQISKPMGQSILRKDCHKWLDW